MGTTIYCLMLVYLAIADGGFDGDDDVRELLRVKDCGDNCDDEDRDLLVVWSASRRWWRS